MAVIELNRLAQISTVPADDLLLVAPAAGVSAPTADETAADTAAAANPPRLVRAGDVIGADALTRMLLGNYDDSLTAQLGPHSWTIDADPGNGSWRDVASGDLTTLTDGQAADGEAMRGAAALRVDVQQGAAPRGWRVQILNAGNVVHNERFHDDFADTETFLFNLPASSVRLFGWRFQVQGGGRYEGSLSFANVVVHFGDGAASAAIRAEISRDTAGLVQQVEEAFVGAAISGGTLTNSRHSAADPVATVIYQALTQTEYDAITPVDGRLYLITE